MIELLTALLALASSTLTMYLIVNPDKADEWSKKLEQWRNK